MSTAIKKRLLFIAPQWVGDAIMSLPLVAQLKREGHSIDVLAIPAVKAVFQCCPDIDQLIVVAFSHGKLQWQLRWKTASELRGRYAKAVVLPHSLKSALIPWLARIPIRRGARGELRYWLINERRTVLEGRHHAQRGRPSMLDSYLSLADVPVERNAIDRFKSQRPRMMIAKGSAGFGNHGLSDAGLQTLLDRELLALCPGAEYGPAKQWPADHFAQTAREWLAASEKRGVIIIGSDKDAGIAKEIANLLHDDSRIVNLAGATNLLEAFHWISRSTVVLANDSGLMHAAAALDVPVVGIFGSSDPGHTPPHSQQARSLWLGLSCSPCFKRQCPLGTTACLKNLPPMMAIDAINALVADAQAARDARPRALQ